MYQSDKHPVSYLASLGDSQDPLYARWMQILLFRKSTGPKKVSPPTPRFNDASKSLLSGKLRPNINIILINKAKHYFGPLTFTKLRLHRNALSILS